MQAQLIVYALFLTTLSDVFCSRVDKLQNAIKYGCPPMEEIPKCHCDPRFSRLSIKCKGPMTDSEFQSILKTLKEYTVWFLEISNYNASSISTDIWKGQNIEILALINVEVEDTSFTANKRHFQGLENSLDVLRIEKKIATAGRPFKMQMDHLRKLTSAAFANIYIPKIGNDWFASGPKSLSSLTFIRNGIVELGDEAFTSLSNLSYLAVSYNTHINMITRSMLPKPATRLSILDFSNNQIRTLPNDIFSEMPALKWVLLHYNLIHTMEEDTWKSVASRIRLVILLGNPLQCDEKMKWICNTKLYEDPGARCRSPSDKKGLTLPQFCRPDNEFIDEKRIN